MVDFHAGDEGTYVCRGVALEGFTETLQGELNPAWNIKVRRTAQAAYAVRMINQLCPHQINMLIAGEFRTGSIATVSSATRASD